MIEGFLRLLGILVFILFNYYYKKSKEYMNKQIYLNIVGYSQTYMYYETKQSDIFINSQNEQHPKLNFLMNNPLYADRKKNVRLLRNEYYQANRNANFSIVLSTYERPEFFSRVIKHLIANRPNNTEIIISDDHSVTPNKKSMLKNVANTYINEDVYVITHIENYGAFHTKLDGFLFSVGNFIMSIDDDDIFDDLFYIELASETSIITSKNSSCNFIIPLDFPYIKRWVRLPLTVNKMISDFHNHVSYAFKRTLLENVKYPNQSVLIFRDDAPLMIPLYAQTNDNQVYYYKNRYRYIVDGRFHVSRQSSRLRSQREYVLNGFYFLMQYMKSINRSDLFSYVRSAYGQYIR